MNNTQDVVTQGEFNRFAIHQTNEMQSLKEGMIRQEIRQDQSERRLDSLETTLTSGFGDLKKELRETREEVAKVKTLRAWITFSVTIGGSAIGTAIYHALQSGVHP